MGSSVDLLKPTPVSFLGVMHPSKVLPDPAGGEGGLSGLLEGWGTCPTSAPASLPVLCLLHTQQLPCTWLRIRMAEAL